MNPNTLTSTITRRTFLRASGVAIALPFLESVLSAAEAKKAAARPPRLVLIGRPLGMHAEYFFPEKAGRDYEPSRYLRHLRELREHFTVFSRMSHRHSAGHFAIKGMMTGLRPDLMRAGTFKNGISLDQEVAAQLAAQAHDQTRFASLVLGGGELAWNRHGVRVPPEESATQVFRALFVSGTPQEQRREIQRLHDGQSILDEVRGQIKSLNNKVSADDRQRLDLFLTSLREAEQQLQQDEDWSKKNKPQVAMEPPTSDYNGAALEARSRQWYDIVRLALQTDSTRVISLALGSSAGTGIEGVSLGHHDASHHGQSPEKLAQLALIEETEIKLFGEFLTKLKAIDEGGPSLLDRTAILHTSSLGNASSHNNHNLPVLLAGGSFKHAGHVAFTGKEDMLLSNLFVRMMHHMGIEATKFGNSDGIISEV